MIDAYDASLTQDDGTGDTSNQDRWTRACDVYYEALVLSSLGFIDDASPYNIAILPQRVDGIVSTVCGNISSADPYFLFKNPGQEADSLEGLQQTVHYALDIARFDRRIRDAALQSALKGRGMLRLRYTTINTGMLADWEDVDTMAADDAADPVSSQKGEVEVPVSGGEVRYSGLVIDAFLPEDMVCYPTWATNVVDMTLVGNRFTQRFLDIQTKQENGRYFADAVLVNTNDAESINNGGTPSIIADPEDYGNLCYDVLVKVKPEPPERADGTRGKGQPEAWYRATILKANRELLALEPYDLPQPWYFGPTLKGDIDRWWPRRSIADRLVEIQTLYNDAWTLIILATAACAFQNVAVANYTGQQTTMKSGLGNFMFFRGNPTFTPIPAGFTPEGVQFIIENIERVADAIARFSQNALGGQAKAQITATETNAINQGQAAGSEDYTSEFGLELERMADMARFLLFINWDAFKAFHGEAITLVNVTDLTMRVQCEVNGKSPNDTPQAALAKVQGLVEFFQTIGFILPPGPNSPPPPYTVNLKELADMAMNAYNMQTSTAKLLEENQPIGPDPNDPNAPQGGIPAGLPPGPTGQAPGQAALPPPEVLQQLMLGLKAKLAAGQMGQGLSGPQGPTGSPFPPAGLGNPSPGPGPM